MSAPTYSAAEATGGRARQDAADEAAAGRAPRCGERVTYGGREHECSRPPHGGNHPHTDAWRRNRGESVSVDHHYFVAVRKGPTQ